MSVQVKGDQLIVTGRLAKFIRIEADILGIKPEKLTIDILTEYIKRNKQLYHQKTK